MNAIAIRDLKLALGGCTILEGVSLDIGSRDFVGVFGPNGSGKTTLMRAILGLISPSIGSICVLGRPAKRGNSSIGYMPQGRETATSIRLRGWDFVASVVNGHRLGLPTLNRAARREVDRVLELVGARELADRPLSELSGGERQRLMLAQTLVGHPTILLLDEPLISLDPRHQGEVVGLVKSLQHEIGATILFSAHDLNPLLGAMDRVLYLGSGKAAIGTVDEVITSPVLSRLYGSDIEVVRLRDRIFVLSGNFDIERHAHRHDHGSKDGTTHRIGVRHV